MTTFDQLDLHPTTKTALGRMGFTTPTPVQDQTIPLLLQGRDVLAQARTGTGKTAAFGIPLIEGCAGDGDPSVLALILVPTRELALQVTEELRRLAHGTNVHVVALYGGAGFDAQLKGLARRAPTAVVATPGRLMDHMERRTVRLDQVRMLVLDEADRMLDMGFLPDVERIVRAVPKQRQTALFSATIPDAIRRLTSRFLREPAHVKIEDGTSATPVAEQYGLSVPGNAKAPVLRALLEKERPERTIVFTRTKHRARSLAKTLERQGWAAVALQGNMTQGQRERALGAFRSGEAKVLVATDVASRGLDVPEVSHVINFDLPDEPEAYVHRIGRTARMGRSGRAFTFVQPDQVRDVQVIERLVGVPLDAYDLDTAAIARDAPPAPAQGRPERGYQGRKQGRKQGRNPGRKQGRGTGRNDGARGRSRSGHGGGNPRQGAPASPRWA